MPRKRRGQRMSKPATSCGRPFWCHVTFKRSLTPTLGSRLVFWSTGASHQSDQIGRTPRYGGVTARAKWRPAPQEAQRLRGRGSASSANVATALTLVWAVTRTHTFVTGDARSRAALSSLCKLASPPPARPAYDEGGVQRARSIAFHGTKPASMELKDVTSRGRYIL